MDAFLNLEGGIRFVLDWILRQMMGGGSACFCKLRRKWGGHRLLACRITGKPPS